MKKDPAGNKLLSQIIAYHINPHTGIKPKTDFKHTYWKKANYTTRYNLLKDHISRGSEINTSIPERIVINFARVAKRITPRFWKEQDHKIGPSIYGAVNK